MPDNNHLSDAPFASLFSQSVACLILLTSPFGEQIFVLVKFSGWILSLVGHTFGVVAKTSSPHPRSSGGSPMLSSRSFIAFCFIFMSLVHFQLVFEKGVRSGSRFITLRVHVRLRQRYFCCTLLLLFLCQRSIGCICVGPFLGSLSHPDPVTMTLTLQGVLKSGAPSPPTLSSSFRVALAGLTVFGLSL